MCTNWRWAESSYDSVMGQCVRLTNHHIRYSPLHSAHETLFKSYFRRVIEIGNDVANERRQTQQKYRNKLLQRLDIQFRAISNNETKTATQTASTR